MLTFVAFFSAATVRNAAAQPKYTVTDLGTLGGSSSFAYGINNSGHVTGFSYPTSVSNVHAFYYDGQMHDLGTLGSSGTPYGSFSAGSGINDYNQIVGTTLDATGNAQAFLWDAQHGMESLSLTDTNGVAINNRGQIVGETAETTGAQVGQAFIWDATTGAQSLPLLPGCILGPAANVTAVNDSSTVVGFCQLSNTNSVQAFVWDNINGIQPLAPGSFGSLAWSINNKGQISGSIGFSSGVGRAAEWAGPSSVQLLPLITDHQGNIVNTVAYSINDQGDAVGLATDPNQYATLWIGSAGYLLDDLIPTSSGWHLIQANGINKARQIVGYGVINGNTHAFRLDPVTDTTPPVIVSQITGSLGNNGWYRGNVTVSWSVTDPESGIASSTGCGQTTLTIDTAGVTLTCSATNGAGLSSSVSVTIKIDKTPPVISGMPAASCTLWPPNGKLVQVAIVTASDALSGLAPGSFKVTGTSNEPSFDPKNPEIVITPNGSGGFVVQLQADRLGNGTGRIYTLTATTNDLAGNTATATATCTVPHDQEK